MENVSHCSNKYGVNNKLGALTFDQEERQKSVFW